MVTLFKKQIKEQTGSYRSWRPSPQQIKLLQTVILSDAAALDAWQSWKQEVDLDHLDEGSYQLLPRLYRRLHQLQVTDELMPRLKGVYRHVWSRNQVNLRQLSKVVTALGQQNITVGLLWGAATVSRPDTDPGICRTDDSSLWVRSHDLPTALAVLQQQGWVPTQNKPVAVLRSQQHAVGLRHSNRANLTLYWHPLSACQPIEIDLWRQAQTVDIGETQVQLLEPTDQFLLSCVRATRWESIPPFHWLADAAALAKQIDSQRLIQHAQVCQLTYALRQALTVLVNLGQTVHRPILQQLQAYPISYFEQVEFHTYSGPACFGSLPRLWCQWMRLQPVLLSDPVISDFAAPNFLTFLQQRWGLSQSWQVPLHVLRQGSRKLYHLGDR